MMYTYIWLIAAVVNFGNIPVFGSGIYTDDGAPNNWPSKYPQCGGKRQSPINLPGVCHALDGFTLLYIARNDVTYRRPKSLKISVSDHSVQIVPSYENGLRMTFWGGPVRDVYVLEQAHFHWGSNNSYGSEHSIDKKFYSLEAHAVHYNAKYGSFDNAQTKMDGLLVVAYLYKVETGAKNAGMDSLAEIFTEMQSKGSKNMDASDFPPMTSLLPPFQSRYLTYLGSLTTPPCYETVTWIVSSEILKISGRVMKAFRGFYKMEPGLVNNFRPVQQLNSRVVTTKLTFVDKLNCLVGRIEK